MKLNFGNPGSAGVNYCSSTGCQNDGFQIQDARIAKRGAPRFRYYRAKSGMEMASTEDFEIGDKFERGLDKDESLPDGFLTYDSEGEMVIEDEVAEQLDALTAPPGPGGNWTSPSY